MSVGARPARRGRQDGFTLIEMVIVVAILGILSATVTLSMVGLTSLARKRANDGEYLAIQDAMTAMMMDQQIDPADTCAGSPPGGTKDMARFPSGTSWTGQGTGEPVSLYPHYVHERWVNRAYACTNGGVQPVGG